MFSSVLLPVDLAAATGWERPRDLAVDLCRRGGGALHVLTVLPDFGMSIVGSYFEQDFAGRAIADVEVKLAAWIADAVPGDVAASPHVAHGTIYDEIMRAADRIGVEAIILGAHRPEMRDYLLGSNAARVVRHARQSVLVVRS
ncbi:MAG: universal stress protein [Pseudomonadota bacterium]